MIKKVGSQFRVLSQSGKPMGSYWSKKAAEKRLSEIEYFKSHPKEKYDAFPGPMSVATPAEGGEKKEQYEHIGWDAMVEKLENQGHSAESAKKIAGSIAEKKYGPGMNRGK